MKKINSNRLVWTIILILLSYCFFKLIQSGDVCNYLHPSMVKYVYIGGFFVLAMAIYELLNIRDGHEERIKLGNLLFLIPIIIYLFFRPAGLSESIVMNRGININFYKEQLNNSLEDSHNHTHLKSDEKLLVEGNKILINNSNFYASIKNIYNNIDKYKNNMISVKGFVIHEKGSKDRFILGRMVVSCCAADTEIIGINATYKYAEALGSGQWVEIEGKVERGDDKAGTPHIKVEKIKKISEPKDKYLYRD